MNFEISVLFKDLQFALGIDRDTGTYLLQIPARTAMIDILEYFTLTKEEFELYRAEPQLAMGLVQLCSDWKCDDRLFYTPDRERARRLLKRK